MGVIRELVSNLAILLILAALMEMLLPMGNLRNFVKMIMGLFLIVTMLNPILRVIKQPVAFQVMDTAVKSETKGILDKGRQMQKANEQTAIRQYEQTLAQQVKAVAKLAPHVQVQDVDVDVDNGSKTGQIKKISLLVTPTNKSQNDHSLVDPVRVETPKISQDEKVGKVKTASAGIEQVSQEDKQTLIETVANFYNLSPDKVTLRTK